MPNSSLAIYTLENEYIRFSLIPASNSWRLEDQRAGVTWSNTPGEAWVYILSGDQRFPLSLVTVENTEAALRGCFVDRDGIDHGFALVFRLLGESLQVFLNAYESASSSATLFGVKATPVGSALPTIELLGIEARADEVGEALLPIRMGLLLPARGAHSLDMHLETYEYEGLHLAMAGLFKSGAALVTTWHDPYIVVHLSRHVEGTSRLCMSFELSKSARSLQLQCLGKGDISIVAKAYRRRATELGYCIPWDEKLRSKPQAKRLFGAGNFKLWTALDRRVGEDLVEKSVTVHWTFDEVAQIAEHLKHDLKLDDMLFHLGGWTNGGYDCRHPDIMPANPECGGNEGLAACAQRVQACGYLFCLHDNYQDMYRDAPSWGEQWLQKNPDGSLVTGGLWLGGRAYITCSREAVRLAKRPQNLTQVRDMIHPDLYFIDTTYAVAPQECFDPRHPLTRQDDIYWKAAISDYARSIIGMFGSECGREWAVPHADFFEGLASVHGKDFHFLKPDELDGYSVPFFDMVFHDCIAIYGKYGYHPAEMASQIIRHAAMGRTLYYHSVGDHLYWEDPATRMELPTTSGLADPAIFTRAHNGWAEGFCLWDRFIKNTQEVLGPLNKRTSQAIINLYEFLDEARLIPKTTFSNSVTVVVNGSGKNYTLSSTWWGEVILPPYGLLIEAGDFIAFLARSWNGYYYQNPGLFTLTSLDNKPLLDSNHVRVFHGFGDASLMWNGKVHEVRREEVINKNP